MVNYLAYLLPPGPKGQRRITFVDEAEIREFSRKKFNPEKMKFTGVRVTADSVAEALQIYEHPTKGDVEYIEEPSVTALKTRLKAALKRIEDGQTTIMAVRLGVQAKHLHKLLAIIARSVYTTTVRKQGSSELTTEEIYENLKKGVLQTLREMKYDGPEDSTGNDTKG